MYQGMHGMNNFDEVNIGNIN